MKRAIGITGYARHGKDTVANYLVERYHYTRLAFADALKNLALEVNPLIPVRRFLVLTRYVRLADYVAEVGWEGAKKNPEVRRVLQDLGTGARYVLGENVWVDAIGEAAFKLLNEGKGVVFSDCRFPNEADAIYALGGEVWRVHRVNADGSEYDNGIGKDHPSEALVPTLRASRGLIAVTMQDLYDNVDAIMTPDWSATS